MTKREIKEKQEKLWAKVWDDHDAKKITIAELRLVIIQLNWDAQYALAELEESSS